MATYTGESLISSLISLCGYATVDPKAPRVQAVFLRAHLRCISAGMNPPRGLRKGDLLAKASNITGVTYKRGHIRRAIDDLTAFIELGY